MVLLVGFCYAEIAAIRPAAGGELVYAYETFGEIGSFFTGWTLALIYVSVCAFEAISLGLVADLLFPGIEGRVLYRAFGEDIHLGGLAIGLIATLALALVNVMGARASARTQEVVTYLRVALMVTFLGIAFAYAKPENLRPLFLASGGPHAFVAFLGVLLTAPLWYAGFSVFATATEERSARSSARRVGRAVVLGIVGAIVFYCLLTLGVSALVPWRQMTHMDLPAATAFQAATGHPWITKIVLLTAVLGTLTAWNAVLIAGSRVLFALGRAGLISTSFGKLHSTYRTPIFAILFITAICFVGAFLGRGFILPIVNITSLGFALTYLVTCLAVYRLRRTDPGIERSYAVPGGMAVIVLAALGSFAIVVIAFIQPFLSTEGKIPVEWLILGAWYCLGGFVWILTAKSRRRFSKEQRKALLRAAN